MSGKELIRGDILLSQLRTNIGVSQTSPDLVPALGVNYMVSEPTRVTIKPILFVTSSDHIVAPIRLRNYKSEDQQEEEEANEDGHAAEIEGQEGFLIPVGADEAGKGNKED